MILNEFEILSPLKSEYIIYDDLKEKLINSEFVYFSDQDFKSLLALSFAIELHGNYLEQLPGTDLKNFNLDSNRYFEITINFGLILLDNLSEFKKEWFNTLLSKQYKLGDFFKYPEIKEFTQEALIDQLNVRQWEYGRYFLESFSKIMGSSIVRQPIKSTQSRGEFWDLMYKKMDAIKEPIENYEAVLLAFFIKKHIEKQDLNMRDYFLLGSIACQKMHLIFKRELNLKQAINEIVSLDQNLNKGKRRGGPKR